jgi:hypothetical protein
LHFLLNVWKQFAKNANFQKYFSTFFHFLQRLPLNQKPVGDIRFRILECWISFALEIKSNLHKYGNTFLG